MLRALIESAARFPDLAPPGYEPGEIRWVIEIDAHSANGSLVSIENARARNLPVRGDRSGKVSEKNLKPALLVDKAAYALGMRKNRRLDANCIEHRGFRSLIEGLNAESPDRELTQILAFFRRFHDDADDEMDPLRSQITRDVKPNEVIAFRAGAANFPFESSSAHAFWRRQLEHDYRLHDAQCCCCGEVGPILRILPWQVSFAGHSCPIASFNKPAFKSFCRDQTANSPLCFPCASRGTRVLQHLLNSEMHHRVLTRDESPGEAKMPLRNQYAVFWLKEQAAVNDGGAQIDLEEIFALPLGPKGEDSAGPPPDPGHIRRLYGLPFSASGAALHLDKNRFYVAVISPNKSRLVLRDWIDESVERVVASLAAYDVARTIQSSDGKGEWRPAIPSMLDALKPWKSKSASNDANLVRALLRTAYQGSPPPVELLEAAVLRFRIPDRAQNGREEVELESRRQTLAAAIKFVFTFGKQEAITLQSLNKSSRSGPYLCGRLLAILEEAQLRASRWRVQATLVDRYYGGASTSPAATFSILINQCSKAHMPKVRKTGAGYQDLEQTLEDVLASIDDQGGFPPPLTLREQGEFALGFYHQRACFRTTRPLAGSGAAVPKASDQEKNA